MSAYSRAVVQRGLERSLIAALGERMRVDPMSDPRPEVVAGAAISARRFALRNWASTRGRADLIPTAAHALTSLTTGAR